MKISNRQITMIRGAANPVEFNGIGARTRNAANQVFEKGDSGRVWRDRFRASWTRRVKAGAVISNYIPDEGIERMGTSIRDMILRCRAAGLAEPEIRLDDGFFVLTIRRKTPEPGAKSASGRHQVTGQVTPPVGEYVTRLLVFLADRGALSNAEILDAFALKDRRRLRDTYIDPALADGLVERTIPKKPTSRLQKYRLTEKGRELLEQLYKEGSAE